jgi:hypothetical protein
MATKKQKRAAGLAKHEAFMAEVKADGLRAQEADRRRTGRSREAMTEAAQEINAWEDQNINKEMEPKPKKQTSFYSVIQGRPVNAATIAAERKQRDDFASKLEKIIEDDLDEWAGLRIRKEDDAPTSP